jgi:hypothetical protein
MTKTVLVRKKKETLRAILIRKILSLYDLIIFCFRE